MFSDYTDKYLSDLPTGELEDIRLDCSWWMQRSKLPDILAEYRTLRGRVARELRKRVLK